MTNSFSQLVDTAPQDIIERNVSQLLTGALSTATAPFTAAPTRKALQKGVHAAGTSFTLLNQTYHGLKTQRINDVDLRLMKDGYFPLEDQLGLEAGQYKIDTIATLLARDLRQLAGNHATLERETLADELETASQATQNGAILLNNIRIRRYADSLPPRARQYVEALATEDDFAIDENDLEAILQEKKSYSLDMVNFAVATTYAVTERALSTASTVLEQHLAELQSVASDLPFTIEEGLPPGFDVYHSYGRDIESIEQALGDQYTLSERFAGRLEPDMQTVDNHYYFIIPAGAQLRLSTNEPDHVLWYDVYADHNSSQRIGLVGVNGKSPNIPYVCKLSQSPDAPEPLSIASVNAQDPQIDWLTYSDQVTHAAPHCDVYQHNDLWVTECD